MRSIVDRPIPLRFEDRTLEGYKASTPSQERALKEARRLVAGEISSLVLIGQTGVGKSHLAAGVVNAVVDRQIEQAEAHQVVVDAWLAEIRAIEAERPQWPANDPVQVAALAEWDAANARQANERAIFDQARQEHWESQPRVKRPSAEWDAWDAEVVDLEAMLRSVRDLAPKGPRPEVAPRSEDLASYRAAAEAWQARSTELESRRPRRLRQVIPAWENVAELILGLRFEMSGAEHGFEEQTLALRGHTAIVVLDDLGREKASDWTGETIYALVNARYEAMLPTLVTSNLTAAELAASPYWPVISRLAEDGALVEIAAPDHRLGKP